MLWFYKSSLRFSVAISLENLRKSTLARGGTPGRVNSTLHAMFL
jgi:hypothetical protein